jgi:PAS domain S-box-containing protein
MSHGQRRSYELRLNPLIDPSGAVVGLTGAALDVTETRRATEAVLATERQFRAVFEAGAVGNAEVELPVGRVIRANRRFAEMTGVGEDEVRGLLLSELAHPEDHAVQEQLLQSLARGAAGDSPIDVRWKDRDGRVVWVQLAGAFIDGADHEGSRGVVVAVDVTERHRLEESLLHARKLEAVGRLAGGVAHDFNNLLTVASGHLELLELEHETEASIASHVDGIREALTHAAALTQHLLTFARREAVASRPLRTTDLIKRTERMLRQMIGAKIELHVRIDSNVDPIQADPAQIEQMLLNLVTNARDALPRGGRVVIEAANVVVDERRAAAIPDVVPGPYVRISVSDSGAGMDPTTLARCLDPFVTTKPPRKGTGLGLSSVYGTARQAGGFLEIESALERGTTARIYFPRSTDQAVPDEEVQVSRDQPDGGDETILVVEDEPVLLQLNHDALEAYGYRVLTAENGERALDIAREHEGRIDLVVTDVVMPVLGGRELAERLPSVRPGVPVLFVSGYTGGGGPLGPGAAFLAKPFTPSELARTIRALLDR